MGVSLGALHWRAAAPATPSPAARFANLNQIRDLASIAGSDSDRDKGPAGRRGSARLLSLASLVVPRLGWHGSGTVRFGTTNGLQ